MVMHVLRSQGFDFDYLVGAQIDGFDKMVRLSRKDILVVEGDEYPSSCLDNRAKMLHYNATSTVITGVAWDHVNIYKTYSDYLGIFDSYVEKLPQESKVFFDMTDKTLLDLVVEQNYNCERVGYRSLRTDKKGRVIVDDEKYDVKVFGEHNMKNLNAAMLLCQELDVSPKTFLESIATFTGAAKRLELISESQTRKIYKDFAHAPSKVRATCEAVRGKYQNAHIVGILELHTFSSLRMSFIKHYKGSTVALDEVVVFYDPQALKQKQLPMLDSNAVGVAFAHQNIKVVNTAEALRARLLAIKESDSDVVLIMSSGNLGGLQPLPLLD